MKMGVSKGFDSITRNLNRGLMAVSRMKWVSAFGFSTYVAGVAGAAGLVFTLARDRKLGFPWLIHTDAQVERQYLVPGLQNLGNNCFLNVILQALASCSYFQPFLQKIMEECESSTIGEWTDSLQLTVALASLLEELCAFDERRVVLSPRQVMFAMTHYNQDFSLTSQQDAEEAFLHLLSSLREEISDCYPPKQSSLADSFASPSFRILSPDRGEDLYEQGRWQQHFLGPFNGILSSSLTCQSCSSQISLNLQFFHSVPLSPVLGSGATIMVGCTLEDCLKKFIAAEQVDNYSCSNCWHISATKYLSLEGADEIEQVRRCNGQDSCTCNSLFHHEGLPWPSNSSYTLKQLSIARCPKILCIQLQRATVNHFGELVKLQGHIGFPSILNLGPFMLERLQCQNSSPQRNTSDIQSDRRTLNCIYGRSMYSNFFAEDRFGCTDHSETVVSSFNLPQTNGSSNSLSTNLGLQANDKVPSEPQLYRLVSVVEHFGRTGDGHYTVYRSARQRSEMNKEDLDESSKPSVLQWFSISDSKVYSVSEEVVLAADASLLFYERF